MNTVFQSDFRSDLRYWGEMDRATARRVLELVDAVIANPFAGLGKPQPLLHILEDCWSRRITQEHRLVYRVKGNQIEFLQARYHY